MLGALRTTLSTSYLLWWTNAFGLSTAIREARREDELEGWSTAVLGPVLVSTPLQSQTLSRSNDVLVVALKSRGNVPTIRRRKARAASGLVCRGRDGVDFTICWRAPIVLDGKEIEVQVVAGDGDSAFGDGIQADDTVMLHFHTGAGRPLLIGFGLLDEIESQLP
ncbi:hypothetical protein KCV07_g361, partial [Aureobasidium melanogenum]